MMNITITEAAGYQIKDMMEAEGDSAVYLRIGVQGGGCSGLSYGLGFEEAADDNDIVLEQHGIKILINKDDAKILEGVSIDYKQSLMGGGFTIDNPNAIATCGCGSSFRTATETGTPEEC